MTVCLFVCLFVYLSASYMSNLQQIFVHATSVAWSSYCGIAIRYLLPDLGMTSCLCIMARNRRRNSDSVGRSMDLSLWHVLKLTTEGAAPDRGRSLISTMSLFTERVSRQCKAIGRVRPLFPLF